MPNLNITRYLGCEGAITTARSSAVLSMDINTAYVDPDFDVFAEGDPLLVFLLENRHLFQTINVHDIVLLKDNVRSIDKRRCYAVRRKVTQLVAGFFQRNIAPHIGYARENMLDLICPTETLVVIAVDYVVVRPSLPVFHSHSFKMK